MPCSTDSGFVIGELVEAGLMHADVLTVRSGGIREFADVPSLEGEADAKRLRWTPAAALQNDAVTRPVAAPFSATGGLKLLGGNLGRSVIKVSSVPDDRHVVEAPARVFDSQACLLYTSDAADD